METAELHRLIESTKRTIQYTVVQITGHRGGYQSYMQERLRIAVEVHSRLVVRLPAAIDLGDPGSADTYAGASVRIGSGDRAQTRRGAPILYGVSVPRRAPHGAAGVRFLQFLLGSEGRAIPEPSPGGTGFRFIP